jgi:hypothetical protein
MYVSHPPGPLHAILTWHYNFSSRPRPCLPVYNSTLKCCVLASIPWSWPLDHVITYLSHPPGPLNAILTQHYTIPLRFHPIRKVWSHAQIGSDYSMLECPSARCFIAFLLCHVIASCSSPLNNCLTSQPLEQEIEQIKPIPALGASWTSLSFLTLYSLYNLWSTMLRISCKGAALVHIHT